MKSFIVLAGTLLCIPAFAVTKTAVKPKKPIKPVKKPVVARPKPKPAVAVQDQNKAQSQLAGGDGIFGRTYTLGDYYHDWNICLKGAEYSVAPHDPAYPCAVDSTHKYLVIHASIKNAADSIRSLGDDGLPFSIVDSEGTKTDSDGLFIRDLNGKAVLDLNPGQGFADYTAAIVIPANSRVVKIILNVGRATVKNEEVVRYFIAGSTPDEAGGTPNPANVIKPLTAPYADPKDKTGSTALADFPAKIGDTLPMWTADVTVESFALADSFGDKTPGDGKKFLIATIKLHNPIRRDLDLLADRGMGDGFDFVLTDADGDTTTSEHSMYNKLSKPEEVTEKTLKMGEDYEVRVYTPVDANTKFKTVKMVLPATTSHGAIYDISDLK